MMVTVWGMDVILPAAPPEGGAFESVRACAIALLGGRVLQADRVSAGNGIVLDWRTVLCGEELLTGGDAFDTAHLFVALVGPAAALGATEGLGIAPAPPPPPVPPGRATPRCRPAGAPRVGAAR